MKKRLAGFLLAAALSGCGPKHSNFVKVDDVALGSVVVYRNGVAYYERRATVSGGTLTVSVPRDRVDDFLKSLTVVDAISRQPLPVSIPREQANDGAYLVMKLQLPSTAPADVVLTYVTESPAWKPSYRVVVNDDGKKVMLEGWAIVDNTSGEDWKGVRVGVGSSSALSFRYDLWSVRQVQRETLAAEEKFAIAPPTGVSPYGGPVAGNAGEAVLTELGDDEIRRPDGHPDNKSTTRVAVAQPTMAPPPAPASEEPAAKKSKAYSKADADDSYDGAGAETIEVTGTPSGRQYGGTVGSPSPMGGGGGGGHRIRAAKHTPAKEPTKPAEVMKDQAKREVSDARVASGDTKMRQLAPKLTAGTHTIVIEGYANANVPDGERRANDRANIVKNQLIDQGVAPARIKVVTKVEPNAAERVRLVAQAPTEAEKQQHGQRGAELDAQPVGESNFFNPLPMTVDKGASAMVAMVHQETEGEVVYLYDAESVRGNDHFAFRAVRFKNPTQSTLETGPVTVYGNKRFIGEGLTEAIPPASSAVVPYALDRQIVVEKNDGEENRIARLVTLQRGILTAEVQHIRRRKLTITNRMNQEAKVFIRHTVNKGWKVVDAPEDFERIGDAHLFQVTLKGNTVRELVISEATPLQRTLDLSADVTLDMMKAYVDAPEATPELRDQLKKLLAIHKSVVDLTEEQVSMRRRLNDYKERMDELHGQIMSLTVVKTGGDLMTHLKSKMKDISDRVQKTTIAIVDQEEKMMLARIQFQDTLAELALNDVTQPGSKPASMSKK